MDRFVFRQTFSMRAGVRGFASRVLAAALMLAASSSALLAQASAAPPAAAPAPQGSPAPSTVSSGVPRALKGPFTVVSASVFRTRTETFQIADIRAPRARTGSCAYERLRGREARKALRRNLARGDVVVTPTGRVSALGYNLVRVTARGRDVRRAMIEAGVVLPRRPGQPSNPWCL